jgi:hypothetical protein
VFIVIVPSTIFFSDFDLVYVYMCVCNRGWQGDG